MSFAFCMVGCGYMAVSRHGPSCKRYESLHPGSVFAACCDIDVEKTRAFKEKFDLPNCYTDIRAMLDAERPQAVCLICPVDKTAELSCLILERGYPLIMEKPPGHTISETRRMIECANAAGIPNQVAFNRRYMPLVREFKELAVKHGGAAGITDIQYRMLRVGRNDADFSTTAIHGIDLVRHIAGCDYKRVSFTYHDQPGWEPAAANIHMDCVMESGALARLDFLPVCGMTTERLEISTERGTFLIRLPMINDIDHEGELIYYEKNKKVLELNGFDAAGCKEDYVLGGFYHENESFLNDIRNGVKPQGDIASGLQSVEVANCILEKKAVYGA